MTETEKREIAQKFIKGLTKQDGSLLRTILTDDVVWSLPGTSLMSGEARGVDAILKRSEILRGFNVKIEIQHVVFGLNDVALLLHNTGREGDALLDEHLATVCRLNGNKIHRLDTFISDVTMLDAFFVREEAIAKSMPRRTAMQGAITTTRAGDVTIHTYTAPDIGWCVNSHVIEFATQLVVIDAQYMLPFSKEVVGYAESLGKPITRLYLTHYHPDHILGAAAFSAPIYALNEVKAKIEAAGDRVAGEEHEKYPDAIPARAERPDRVVSPGTETIDGVSVDFIRLQHAETENALMIALPDHGLLITQDLVYHKVHAFIAERAFETWLEGIRRYQDLGFTHVLPGHGAPGGPELFGQMADYLSLASRALSESSDGESFKARLISAFPAFAGQVLLDHQERFLFPKRK